MRLAILLLLALVAIGCSSHLVSEASGGHPARLKSGALLPFVSQSPGPREHWRTFPTTSTPCSVPQVMTIGPDGLDWVNLYCGQLNNEIYSIDMAGESPDFCAPGRTVSWHGDGARQ